ncbi:hypothetical protein LCGC14_0252190 [marine sediment metagenome]|uniref:Uncharacterized protein n=1 Tax=marine sediment metagenome TaxID=412755 RepID=A0A0F9UL20_9ZZZZ
MPRAVAPRVGCREIMMAEEQPEYLTCCVAVVEYSDGTVGTMTRWKLDDAERAEIAAGEDVYLTLMCFGQPMQPIQLEIGRPDWAPDEEAKK